MDVANSTVAVIGGGMMGTGIAQVCAAGGYRVDLVEESPASLETALQRIREGLLRQFRRQGRTDDEAKEAGARITGLAGIEQLNGQDLIIEAVPEQMELKRAVFRDLGRVMKPNSVLASNTSSLPLSEMAYASGHPERVIGIHFFNPPTALKLVEIVTHPATSAETIECAIDFCNSIDRVTIRAGDTPGFIVNRLLVPFIFDAIRMVESGLATAEDVDRGCTAGLGHALGPLATADLVGLDTLVSIGDSMFHEFGDARFKPPTLLRRFVSLGMLGRKNGRGFLEAERANASGGTNAR